MKIFLIPLILAGSLTAFAQSCFQATGELLSLANDYYVRYETISPTKNLDRSLLQMMDNAKIQTKSFSIFGGKEQYYGIEISDKGEHFLNKLVARYKRVLPDTFFFTSYDFTVNGAEAAHLPLVDAIFLSPDLIVRAINNQHTNVHSTLSHEARHAYDQLTEKLSINGYFIKSGKGDFTADENPYQDYFTINEIRAYLETSRVFLGAVRINKKDETLLPFKEKARTNLKEARRFLRQTREYLSRLDLKEPIINTDKGEITVGFKVQETPFEYLYSMGKLSPTSDKLTAKEKDQLFEALFQILEDTHREIDSLEVQIETLIKKY